MTVVYGSNSSTGILADLKCGTNSTACIVNQSVTLTGWSIVTSGGTFTGWSIDTGSGEAGSGEAGSGEAGSGSTAEVSVLEYLCEELEPNLYAYFGMYGPGDGDVASGDFSSGDPEVCDAVRLYSIVALITAVLLVPIVVMLRCYGGKRVLLPSCAACASFPFSSAAPRRGSSQRRSSS